MICFDTTKCWKWEGPASQGYGCIKQQKVHRILASYFYDKKLTAKDFVCHKCNNRWCFNPEHLYIGTAKTNAEDRIKCGQQKETNQKIRKSLIGIKFSAERKKNQSEAQKRLYAAGYINPRKGLKRIMIDGKIKYI